MAYTVLEVPCADVESDRAFLKSLQLQLGIAEHAKVLIEFGQVTLAIQR